MVYGLRAAPVLQGAHFPGFAMDRYLKALLEERLKHGRELGAGNAGGGFRRKVESVGIEPVQAGDLERLNAVRSSEENTQRYVLSSKRAAPEAG